MHPIFTFAHAMYVAGSVFFLVLIWRVAFKLEKRRKAQQAEADSFADDMRMSDDEYLGAITGPHRALRDHRDPEPGFAYDKLYRGEARDRLGRPLRTDIPLPPEHPVTGTLPPLPDPVVTGPVAKVVERDDYITGRAVRIIRRAEEERKGWHWDELLGEWKPGTDMIRELPWDDWLRQLLLSAEEGVAA